MSNSDRMLPFITQQPNSRYRGLGNGEIRP